MGGKNDIRWFPMIWVRTNWEYHWYYYVMRWLDDIITKGNIVGNIFGISDIIYQKSSDDMFEIWVSESGW